MIGSLTGHSFQTHWDTMRQQGMSETAIIRALGLSRHEAVRIGLVMGSQPEQPQEPDTTNDRTPANAELVGGVQAIYHWLYVIANNGERAPNAREMADYAGYSACSGVTKSLNIMKQQGLIEVEYRGGIRRFYVVELGRWTDWSQRQQMRR